MESNGSDFGRLFLISFLSFRKKEKSHPERNNCAGSVNVISPFVRNEETTENN
jgi:hypothetical protein